MSKGTCWICKSDIIEYNFGKTDKGKHHTQCRIDLEAKNCFICGELNHSLGKIIGDGHNNFIHRDCSDDICVICNERLGNKYTVANEMKIHKHCISNSICWICNKVTLYKDDKNDRVIVEKINDIIRLKHNHCIETKCFVCDSIIADQNHRSLYGKLMHNSCSYICECGKVGINHINDVKPKYCKAQEYACLSWIKNNHSVLPKDMKKNLMLVLLINKTVWKLPREILHIILFDICNPFDAKNAKYSDWIINLEKLCIPTRCISHKCSLCNEPLRFDVRDTTRCSIPNISTEGTANSFFVTGCVTYQFKCRNCKNNIPHGSDLETTCTQFRCFILNSNCDKCGKNIKCLPDRNGCETRECHTLLSEMTSHITFILESVGIVLGRDIINEFVSGGAKIRRCIIALLWEKVSYVKDIPLGTNLMMRMQRLELINKY